MHVSNNPSDGYNGEKQSVEENPKETPLQIKGISTTGKIEHVDLLRPVYRQDQATDENKEKLADQ